MTERRYCNMWSLRTEDKFLKYSIITRTFDGDRIVKRLTRRAANGPRLAIYNKLADIKIMLVLKSEWRKSRQCHVGLEPFC